jgi:hypothetical protein
LNLLFQEDPKWRCMLPGWLQLVQEIVLIRITFTQGKYWDFCDLSSIVPAERLTLYWHASKGATTAREIATVTPASQPASQCAFFLAQRFVNFFPTNLYLCHYIMILSRFASYKTLPECTNSNLAAIYFACMRKHIFFSWCWVVGVANFKLPPMTIFSARHVGAPSRPNTLYLWCRGRATGIN